MLESFWENWIIPHKGITFGPPLIIPFTKNAKEFLQKEKKCTFAAVKNPPLDVQGKWVWLNLINFNNAS